MTAIARAHAALSIAITFAAIAADLQPVRADQGFFPITRTPEARFLPVAHSPAAAGQIVPADDSRFFPVRRQAMPEFAATHAPATTILGARPGATAAVIRTDRDFFGLPGHAVARRAPAHPAAVAAAPVDRAPAAGLGPRHAWPVDAAADSRITSRFGWRADPFTGEPAFHAALDIAAAAGTAAVATAPAVVKAIGAHPRLGRYVMLDFGDGTVATYGHLRNVAVATGDAVARGQRIGGVGSTGRATGPHLDFSFEVAGRRIDPLRVVGPPAALVAGR